MNRRFGSIAFAALLIAGLAAATALADRPNLPTDLTRQDADGRQVAIPYPVDDRFKNPVTDAYEDGFIERAQIAIKHNTGKGNYGNTYFENEKGSYPPAMFDVVYGNRQKGLNWLMAEDNQAGSWNSQTKGIDLYPSFTLKNQMRKYFYLGHLLEPAYRKRMYEAAKLWTAEDPMRRRNKYFKGGGHGWTPETKNSWVDVRNTDNLRAMRETSIYLMAEEVGNEKLRQAYKQDIQRYVWALWHIGMGEWDSENYHFHTIAPYINLYDFAKDPEMKRTAKAALDMLFTMAAVKYYHGGWVGPIKREYNKPYVFGGAAGEAWLYFGDTPLDNPHPHGDMIHMITSSYRPPMAVVELARKDATAGTEIFASKPTYETWKVEGGGSASHDYPAPNYQQADHEPWVFETTYWGHTFQLGTLPQGSFGDVNGFKLLMKDSRKGAQFFVAASGTSPSGVNRGKGADKVAQYRNLAIMVTPKGNANWSFVIPADAKVEDVDGVRFIQTEQTWLALHPINLKLADPDGKAPKNWANTQAMTAEGTGGALSGFVLEVGEKPTHDSYNAFKKDVLKQKPQVSGKTVSYTGTAGKRIGIDLSEGGWLPKVIRDGEVVQWDESRWPLYQPADGGKEPIHLGWKTGKLHIQAGGHTFEATYPDDHEYEFESD